MRFHAALTDWRILRRSVFLWNIRYIRFTGEYTLGNLFGIISTATEHFFLILNCRCFSRMRTEKIFYCSKKQTRRLAAEEVYELCKSRGGQRSMKGISIVQPNICRTEEQ